MRPWSIILEPTPVLPEAPSVSRLVADDPSGGGMISVDDGKGMFVINTPRTVGGFTEGGSISAGVQSAEILDFSATL